MPEQSSFTAIGTGIPLIDLDPYWIGVPTGGEGQPSANYVIFSFLCPHCRKVRLAVGKEPVVFSEQLRAYEALGDGMLDQIVPFNPETKWDIKWSDGMDFRNVTIIPSIDASKSGHWHGTVQNGMVY